MARLIGKARKFLTRRSQGRYYAICVFRINCLSHVGIGINTCSAEEGSEIEKISIANELALARAHVAFPAVIELERRIPEWLIRLSTDAGVREFEAKHGLEMPSALRHYYKSTRLICLLQAAWSVDVFLEDMDNNDPPGLEYWNRKPHLVIGYYLPGDTTCGTELIGDHQYMYWEGFSERRELNITLSEWVCGAAHQLLL